MENKIKLFESKKIRTAWNEDEDEWYFSVLDVVEVLTDSADYQTARKYWNKLSQRLSEEGSELVTICHRLKMIAFNTFFCELIIAIFPIFSSQKYKIISNRKDKIMHETFVITTDVCPYLAHLCFYFAAEKTSRR